ncbi:MAG: hypothetical protein ACRC2T_04420, partial [Thermoguttaceae bacterium]
DMKVAAAASKMEAEARMQVNNVNENATGNSGITTGNSDKSSGNGKSEAKSNDTYKPIYRNNGNLGAANSASENTTPKNNSSDNVASSNPASNTNNWAASSVTSGSKASDEVAAGNSSTLSSNNSITSDVSAAPKRGVSSIASQYAQQRMSSGFVAFA